MTLNELMEKILEILPDARIGADWDGEVEIYTGLMTGEKIPNKIPTDYQLVKFKFADEEEE